MGIAVTVAQLLGLIAYALSKLVDPSLVGSNKATMFKNRLVVPLLAGLGLWNIAWYGCVILKRSGDRRLLSQGLPC